MIAFRRLAGVACIVSVWLAQVFVAQSRAQAQSQVVPLQTRDGVQLKVTYFPSRHRTGTSQAKQVAPVVLLHDHKETRAVFTALAQRLQGAAEGEPNRPSFAAVTVDLRGHGDSTKQVLPNGTQVDLDAARLGKNDFLAMVAQDMEAVRGLLFVKNDAGELNMDKLCIVGAGMGASVAANWAAQDWATPPLAVGKQGQDVKALVLVSPRWTFNGLSMQTPMRFRPLKQFVAWQLIFGEEDQRVKADVNRIERQLEPFATRDAANANQPQHLVVIPVPSKLQGGTLISQVGPQVESQIIRFLSENVAQMDRPWTTRLNLVR
jgi:pimeloyl-ACP methyl ester carboxylesterase